MNKLYIEWESERSQFHFQQKGLVSYIKQEYYNLQWNERSLLSCKTMTSFKQLVIQVRYYKEKLYIQKFFVETCPSNLLQENQPIKNHLIVKQH